MTESWQLKLRRAEEHLEDLTARIKAIAKPGRRPFRVEKERRADGNWYYSAHMDAITDEMLPVVIGEFLFNLRSALDHLTCATANSRSQFPIYTEDIWRQPASSREAQRLYREQTNWNRWTKGMKPDVLAIVERVQPYHATSTRGTDPHNDALAILNDFQNADKHRELLITQGGARGAISTIPGYPPFDFAKEAGITDGMLRDGAVFLAFGKEVDVGLQEVRSMIKAIEDVM